MSHVNSMLDHLPKDWRRTQIGRYARFRNGADAAAVDDPAGEYPVYGSGGEFRRASDYLYDGESVLFGRKGTVDRPLHVSGRFWTVDTMFYTVVDQQYLAPRFLYYWGTCLPYGYWQTNTALPSMTSTDLSGAPLPLPDRTVQQKIADYLDRETAEIDAFIADQEELIALLEERRASSATSILELQSGWPTGNIRRYALMRTGHTPSRAVAEYWEGTSIPWFTLADVWQLRGGARFLGDTKEKISALGLANSAAELLPAGTVVLSRTASVGFTGIMPRAMATSQDYWNWVPGPQLSSEYLWYQFKSMRPTFLAMQTGSTHKTIYQSDAAAIAIVVPPLDVQRRICQELDDLTRETDATIADAHEAIALSKERRAALISAAVTGQIDVTARKRVLV